MFRPWGANLEPGGHTSIYWIKMADIGEMMANYRNYKEIENKLQENGLEWYIYIYNGGIEFFHCEFCDGPTLGHSTTKC